MKEKAIIYFTLCVSYITRRIFILFIFLVSHIDIYAQRSRDRGRDYSDMKPLDFSKDTILMSFLIGPALFFIGQAIIKYYGDEKDSSKSFLGVIVIWTGIIFFIPALQFLLTLGALISVIFICGFVLYAIVSGLFEK